MNRYYEFPNKKDELFICDPIIFEICKYTLNIAISLVRVFLGETKLNIELIERDEECKRTQLRFTNQSKKQADVTIFDDTLVIEYENERASFTFDGITSDTLTAILDAYDLDADDFHITEEFDRHSVAVSISFDDIIYGLYIPMDTEKTLDLDELSSITESYNILDLRKFYFDNYYKRQERYDRELSTILRIYSNQNSELILTDELSIENGFVTSYQISYVKDGFILSIRKPKDGIPEYTFNKIPPKDFSLVEESKKLESMSCRINLTL